MTGAGVIQAEARAPPFGDFLPKLASP